MGVPAFYRWLSQKYPRIIADAIEEYRIIEGQHVPTESYLPNPNGIEFDNLYLDMNNIIHPCVHPEDRPAPATEEEMFAEIFKYIDRVFAIIRPRKILYMGIDGVAPRAKMNQQRSRRFKASKEATERAAHEQKIRENWIREGREVPPLPEKRFDSNVITPGTKFMWKLAQHLRYYCKLRQSTDPAWTNVKVIFSDSNCPGEGEHKIMEFIRLERLQPDYNPNTHHVIYGLDADLIMLALASHEARFTILREEITDKRAKPPSDEQNRGNVNEEESKESSKPQVKPFQLLNIYVLREYLEKELFVENLPFKWDFENAIDDFVFLCFFVGNDFLPHLPSLDIREGAIDALMVIYKKLLPEFNGYLTTNGKIDLKRAQLLINELGRLENAVFQRRKEIEEVQKRRKFYQKRQRDEDEKNNSNNTAQNNNHNQNNNNNSNNNNHNSNNASDPKRNLTVAQLLREELKKESAESSKPEQRPTKKAKVVHEETETVVVPLPKTPPKTDPMIKNLITVVDSFEPKRKSKSSTEIKVEETKSKVEPNIEEPNIEEPKLEETKIEESKVEVIEEIEIIDDEDEEDSTPIKKGISPKLEQELKKADFQTELKMLEKEMNTVEEVVDEIGLGQAGWKERYYKLKFYKYLDDDMNFHYETNHESDEQEQQQNPQNNTLIEDDNNNNNSDSNNPTKQLPIPEPRSDVKLKFHSDICRNYVEGLQWVLSYYYDGCCSWNWYYHYHYSPFASDLIDIESLEINFEKGQPFHPFEQLLAVLPPASSHALPAPFRKLMTDPTSPIRDFYPKGFKEDMNGKKFRWMSIALLPFINQERLLQAVKEVEHQLTEEEKIRNAFSPEILFVSASHPMAPQIDELLEATTDIHGIEKMKKMVAIDASKSDSLFGYIAAYDGCSVPGGPVRSPLSPYIPDIQINRSYSVVFYLPHWQQHLTKMLPGAVAPEKKCTDHDMYLMFQSQEALRRRCVALGQGGRGDNQRGGGGDTPMQRMVSYNLGFSRSNNNNAGGYNNNSYCNNSYQTSGFNSANSGYYPTSYNNNNNNNSGSRNNYNDRNSDNKQQSYNNNNNRQQNHYNDRNNQGYNNNNDRYQNYNNNDRQQQQNYYNDRQQQQQNYGHNNNRYNDRQQQQSYNGGNDRYQSYNDYPRSQGYQGNQQSYGNNYNDRSNSRRGYEQQQQQQQQQHYSFRTQPEAFGVVQQPPSAAYLAAAPLSARLDIIGTVPNTNNSQTNNPPKKGFSFTHP